MKPQVTIKKWTRNGVKTALVISLCAGIALAPVRANACCVCKKGIEILNKHVHLLWDDAEKNIMKRIDSEFIKLEQFMIRKMWGAILPGLMKMTNEVTAVAIYQAEIIGTLFDAKQHMETQQIFGELKAEAHREYQPSESICEMGTTVKALAASERLGEFNSYILARRSLERQVGLTGAIGANGGSHDRAGRLAQFKEFYCDLADDGGKMNLLCKDMAASADTLTSVQKDRLNKDIDFIRTVDGKWTLGVNFTDTSLLDSDGNPNDERNVLALGTNLFGEDLFKRLSKDELRNGSTGELSTKQRAMLDMRAIIAKRNVLESSYNAIIGMKSEGAPGSADYMKAMLEELGVPTGEVTSLIGDNPSYYAQMEVLTQKAFQNPAFFRKLYDSPENVERKKVALQAVELMQKFDMLKSTLRDEASTSIWLELAIIKLQRDVENEAAEVQSEAQKD